MPICGGPLFINAVAFTRLFGKNSPSMQLPKTCPGIGTESAFEVLVRARALEKQGKNIIHLEIGEPDFPTPAHIVEAGKRALDEGWTKYGPYAGLSRISREHRGVYLAYTRHQSRRGQRLRRSWRKADHVLHHGRAARARRRSDLSQPGLPDLRIHDPISSEPSRFPCRSSRAADSHSI